MSTVIEPKRKVTPPPPDNPWYYGFREVYRTQPDGTTKHERIPLTLEDALHPQEGDQIMVSDVHDLVRDYLSDVCRWRTADDPEALILSDTGIYWEDPHVDFTHHCPDLAALFGIKSRKPEYASFFCGKERVRPKLIIELVSPNTRKNDVVDKVDHYHQVEVPVYVIADRLKVGDPWTLYGYQWRPDAYVPMAPDANGRLWLEAVGVWLGTDGIRLVCYDRYGAEIGNYTAMATGLEAVKQCAEAEKRRAEAAEAKTKALEAELARLRGQ
jgi:hypothetical protein